MARYPQDVNLSPDFPTAAALFAKMYTGRTGTAVDGVVAIDPVALSYLLEGTGPVDVGDGVVLTSDTVVPVLLSTVYARFANEPTQARRDAFLAHASAIAFAPVMSGDGDARAIMNGMRRATVERRVLVWSAEHREQADLALTPVAGLLSEATGPPTIGVFLNDGTGAELGYYLHNTVALGAGDCRPDGRRELAVTITLHYTAPSAGLPAYVRGSVCPAGRMRCRPTCWSSHQPAAGWSVRVATGSLSASCAATTMASRWDRRPSCSTPALGPS